MFSTAVGAGRLREVRVGFELIEISMKNMKHIRVVWGVVGD